MVSRVLCVLWCLYDWRFRVAAERVKYEEHDEEFSQGAVVAQGERSTEDLADAEEAEADLEDLFLLDESNRPDFVEEYDSAAIGDDFAIASALLERAEVDGSDLEGNELEKTLDSKWFGGSDMPDENVKPLIATYDGLLPDDDERARRPRRRPRRSGDADTGRGTTRQNADDSAGASRARQQRASISEAGDIKDFDPGDTKKRNSSGVRPSGPRPNGNQRDQSRQGRQNGRQNGRQRTVGGRIPTATRAYYLHQEPAFCKEASSKASYRLTGWFAAGKSDYQQETNALKDLCAENKKTREKAIRLKKQMESVEAELAKAQAEWESEVPVMHKREADINELHQTIGPIY